MVLAPGKVTVSSGGVVIDPRGMVLLVNQKGTSWSLPKGHVEGGEDPVQTAIREIMEESGVVGLHFMQLLGAYGRYKIGENGGEDKNEWKIIILFLFKTGEKDLNHPQARWVNPDEVKDILTHPKDKAFWQSIRSRIK